MDIDTSASPDLLTVKKKEMNIKAIKKIRKRYRIKVVDGMFWVGDTKNGSVTKYKHAWLFVSHWVYDNMGIRSGFKYEKRIIKRRNFSEYKKAFE